LGWDINLSASKQDSLKIFEGKTVVASIRNDSNKMIEITISQPDHSYVRLKPGEQVEAFEGEIPGDFYYYPLFYCFVRENVKLRLTIEITPSIELKGELKLFGSQSDAL
jgi:hypothetical protein